MTEPKIVKGSSNRRTLQEKVDDALKNKGKMPYMNKYGMDAKRLHQKLSETRKVVKGKIKRKKATDVNNRQILSKFKFPTKVHHTVREVPEWFKVQHKKVDVSIIIPLHRSSQEIKDQIVKWNSDYDGLVVEIIYISDCCPEHSEVFVLNGWTTRKNGIKNGVGQIILNKTNVGFGPTCNTGAQHARGEYLIFLNADTVPTKGWIKPMYDDFKQDQSIGIVGNLQLRADDAKIDSAGSEWSWKTKSFPHIGRNVWKGKNLDGAADLNSHPSGMLDKGYKDMVTGCCFMMPAKLFYDLGGFDTEYHIGYWEDADLCMQVKDEGYKILFEPKSVIYHKLGHANSGGHPYMQHNRDKFWKRWGATGRIDPLVEPKRNDPPLCDIKSNIEGKVVGCIIACNEEEFLAPSVESIAPVVDEFIFVIGGNEYAYQAGMCNKKGYPNDNTLGIAKRLVKKYGGHVIEPPNRLWKDKIEMRNAYVEHLNIGDWMWMLDGDEIYKPRQLWRCTELMKNYEVIIMQFWLFWNNMNTIGTGKWEHYPQERIVKWHSEFAYRGSNHLHVSRADGDLVNGFKPCYRGDEKLFYHYSWVRPIQKIRQKLLYYKYQSGNNNDIYVDDIFLKYRENPEVVDGKTHPMGGGNFKPFPGIHPKEIQKLIKEGKFNF